MKYTKEQIEAIAAKLREMPPVQKKQEYSKQEAVRMLSKEIVALQKRGYTLEHIAEMLSGEGLSIATPTLKAYLQRAKKSSNNDKPRRRTRPAAKNETATAEVKSTFTPPPDSDDI